MNLWKCVQKTLQTWITFSPQNPIETSRLVLAQPRLFDLPKGLTSKIVTDVHRAFTLSSKQELHFFNRSLQDGSERHLHSGKKTVLKFAVSVCCFFCRRKFIIRDFFEENSPPWTRCLSPTKTVCVWKWWTNVHFSIFLFLSGKKKTLTTN